MYISKKFIYIHIPKSGGQSLLRIFNNSSFLLRGRQVRFHQSVANINADRLKDKKIYAVVRNPWEWYVSWFHYLRDNPSLNNALYKAISEDGENDFDKSMNRLFDMIEEGTGELSDAFDTKLEDVNSRRPLQFVGDDMDRITAWDCGLQSYYFHWLVFGNNEVHDFSDVVIGKQESSREDATKFFESLELMNERFKKRLANHRRLNKCKIDTSDYQSYYSDALRDRVAKKEQYIIENYNYSFKRE